MYYTVKFGRKLKYMMILNENLIESGVVKFRDI